MEGVTLNEGRGFEQRIFVTEAYLRAVFCFSVLPPAAPGIDQK
jgi:hypothetical protein